MLGRGQAPPGLPTGVLTALYTAELRNSAILRKTAFNRPNIVDGSGNRFLGEKVLLSLFYYSVNGKYTEKIKN